MLQNNKNYILRMENWKSELPDSSNGILLVIISRASKSVF